MTPAGGQPWTECRTTHREAGELAGDPQQVPSWPPREGSAPGGRAVAQGWTCPGREIQRGSDQRDRQLLRNLSVTGGRQLNLTWKYVAAIKFMIQCLSLPSRVSSSRASLCGSRGWRGQQGSSNRVSNLWECSLSSEQKGTDAGPSRRLTKSCVCCTGGA